MKKISTWILIVCLLFLLVGCSKQEDNQDSNTTNNYTATPVTNPENTTNLIQNNESTNELKIGATQDSEEELASFSTKLGGRDTPRSHNISITTSTLNETLLKNGETFSFCNTVGKATSERGYKEADSFDANGNTVQTLGGGNCQVSSTLYNAVLKVNELKVVERHAHSKPVHYVPKDKDAAVAHGSVDLKFKNNTGNTLKIYSNSDLKSVNIRIVKLSNQ